jgi:sulfur relay (sulfurtransferase) DsrF/TusC family protein
MPYSIEYDPQGIVNVKVQGSLTMAVILEYAPGVAQLVKEQDCPRILSDLREAELKLSMLEIYSLPRLFAEIASLQDLQMHTLRQAVVIAPGEPLFHFFETVSRNRVQSVKIFYDDESARQWLLNT